MAEATGNYKKNNCKPQLMLLWWLHRSPWCSFLCFCYLLFYNVFKRSCLQNTNKSHKMPPTTCRWKGFSISYGNVKSLSKCVVIGNLWKGCSGFSSHQCDNVFDPLESRPLCQSLSQRLSWENSSSRQLIFRPSHSVSPPQIHTHANTHFYHCGDFHRHNTLPTMLC